MAKKISFILSFASMIAAVFLYQNCGSVKFGAAPPDGNNIVDKLLCQAGLPSGGAQQMYPTECLINPGYVRTNSVGFQMNQMEGGVLLITADDPAAGIANPEDLYIELATYSAPDSFVISYELNGDGVFHTVLNICNISTYPQPDYFTGSTRRPYSDTILQFRVSIPAGTTRLKVDLGNATAGVSGSTTANYIGIWNLNQFTQAMQTLQSTSLANTTWRHATDPNALTDITKSYWCVNGSNPCNKPFTQTPLSLNKLSVTWDTTITYRALAVSQLRFVSGPPVPYNDQTSSGYYDGVTPRPGFVPQRPQCGNI